MSDTPIRIDQPIVGCEVVKEEKPSVSFQRPQVLDGATYKIKPPDSDHAIYVTINHTVADGQPRLVEIFVNSKNMAHFPWVVALTRVISAIFRHESKPTFLVEELRSVFDPNGGFWSDGRYVPSLVAEIGNCLQRHMVMLGIVDQPEVPSAEDNRQSAPPQTQHDHQPKPQGICEKCGAFAVVFSGGCDKCQECGISKKCSDS